MKKVDVSARKVACRGVFALGCFVFIQLGGARDARAESRRKVEGFEAVGTLGYGVAVGDVESEPYGVMVGLDLGYTFRFGLRIGTDASYGFGRRTEQTRWTGEVVTTHASSINWGGSVGYDLLLSSFRLRGAVDSGFAFWYDTVDATGDDLKAGVPIFYIGPKVALIWQYRAFELGLQSKFWASFEGTGAFQVGLMSGARF
jgi:hypothetical protein